MKAMLNRRQALSWAAALASGVLLLALAALFMRTGLDNADKLASVVGALVGVAGLAGSLYGLVLARRSLDSASPTRPADTDAAALQPLPEAARLLAPSGLAALPRPASRVFVGRETELARLERGSDDTAGLNVQVVCGLGGVGKSELALQFADRNRGRFPLIWWIDAATPETLLSGLADLARSIASGTASSAASRATNEEAVSWVMAWLAAHPGWLLVFDDVNEAASLRPYLGRLHGGHVLVTTRRTAGWHDLFTPIDLEVLSRPAAVALLAELTRSSEAEQLDALAGDLGDLPLALAQAGAYIAHTGIGVRRYRDLLRASPKRMYASAPAGGDPEKLVAKAWAVTRARIGEISPLAIDMLNLLTCFAPDDLPRDVLVRAVDADELDAVDAMSLLASFSMIDLADDGVSVHRLVQAVTLHQLDDAYRAALRARAGASLDDYLPARPADPASWPVYARLLPHVVVVLQGNSAGLSRTVEYLDAISDYATAVRLQQRVVDATSERAGADYPSALIAKAKLARFTGMAGDAGAARDQYARLLPLFDRHFGPGHEQTLTLRVRLAEWTGEAGAWSAAYDEYTRLLPLLDKVLGPEHPETLHARMDFANWMSHLGNPAGAREVCLPLLLAAEPVWGPEHPDTLTLRGCLAYFTGQTGNASEARDQYAALLSLRERVNGPDHPETLATSRDLATWIGEAGDPQQARDRLADLVPLFEYAWGREHPTETLVAKDLHADYTGRAGNPAAARQLLADLLPIRERTSGVDHPLTRATRANLARWAEEPVTANE
jgi:hypothetical protein